MTACHNQLAERVQLVVPRVTVMAVTARMVRSQQSHSDLIPEDPYLHWAKTLGTCLQCHHTFSCMMKALLYL